MVLRKPSPIGGLSSSSQPSTAPYPVTPTSDTPPAPDISAFTSPSQIFSQSLQDSPAFRLEPIGQAQRSPVHTTENPWANELPRPSQKDEIPPILKVTGPKGETVQPANSEALPPSLQIGKAPEQVRPRSSSESDGSEDEDWWDRDDDDVSQPPKTTQNATETAPKTSNIAFSQSESTNPFADFSPQGVKRKPVSSADPPVSPPVPTSAPPAPPAPSTPPSSLSSKNPFRRNLSSELTGNPVNAYTSQRTPGDESPIPKASANLSSPDVRLADFSSAYTPTAIHKQDGPPSPVSTFSRSDQAFSVPRMRPPIHSSAPPDPPLPVGPPYSEQPPLIPVASDTDQGENPWMDSRDPGFRDTAGSTRPPTQPSQDSYQTVFQTPTEQPPDANLIDTSISSDPPVDLPVRNVKPKEPSVVEETPPPKPSRPTVQVAVLSTAELDRLQRQRSETYPIKHFNWLDPKTKSLRHSSMLIQNKNGPCPLLALVNALILNCSENQQSALEKALRSREQISLGLLIESLMDELTSDSRNPNVQLPDVDDLNRFLLTLHTGLNANPKFAEPVKPINLMDARNSILHIPSNPDQRMSFGGFEMTSDIQLYGAFDVPLIHGWIPPPSNRASGAFVRSAHTYEDAQTIMFGEEELEARLTNDGLSPVEQQMLQDIVTIKGFFESYPTQLTPYGLELIHERMPPGSFSILFRNDHFSTLFKHPQSGQVFTLVTDAGYATHDEVIWESLVDVSGQGNEMYSGDFRPVGNTPEPDRSSGMNPSAAHSQGRSDDVPASPRSPQQEQADADFALALQLQDEEEQRAETNRRNRASSTSSQPQAANTGRRPARPQQQDIRPMIPPRTSRQTVNNQRTNQGVNRPADDNDEAPPPSYDEAAKGAPYIPPGGNHVPPATNPNQYIPNNGPSQQAMPRPSPHQNPSSFHGNLGQPLGPQQMVGQGGRQRDRDRDCIVM